MGISIETLVAAKKFTSETVLGGGAVVGKNVTISSITPIEGGNKVTFSYTLDNGTVKTSTMDVMDGKDGVSVTGVLDKGNGAFTLSFSDGTESDAIQTVKGEKGEKGNPGEKGEPGNDGVTPNLTIGTVETLDAGTSATASITGDKENPVLNLGIPKGVDGQGCESSKDYRWQYVEGIVSPRCLYNYKTKTLENAGNQYTSVRYVLNGEKKIRFSGTTSGSSAKLAYVFLDSDGNAISYPSFVSGQRFDDVILDVPDNSYEVRINGNNYTSAHIEVAVEDLQADIHTLPYLLNNLCKKIQYKDTFAWKPMDTGYIAFTFDDSLDDIASVVDLFISKGVPCCFGAIPEKLNMSLSNGETIAQAMKRGVDTVGCEVLAHGSSATEIVTADNIDDMNFLYNKFIVNKQKFLDMGFDVRGTVRVGGNGNICNDPRTDVWNRVFFDYGDLYGVEEPYNHARFTASTTEAYYKAIDIAISEKTFTPLLFHAADLDELPNMIDYVVNNGGKIATYAIVYDTFGSTVETVDILNRISAIENADGNEVAY